jgi:hypothetical protein
LLFLLQAVALGLRCLLFVLNALFFWRLVRHAARLALTQQSIDRVFKTV